MFIYCSDEGLKEELESLLGDETLKREPELSNGVDDLRFVLMVSKVSLTVRIGFVFAREDVDAGRERVAVMVLIGRGVQ